MKLTLDANPGVTLVRSYSNGALRVGEQVFQRSCILTRDAVIPQWRPTKVEEIEERDLEALFAAPRSIVSRPMPARTNAPRICTDGNC